ncbi:Putrescine transport system permease protein PotH [Marinibacterium anthonyi]|nr:Putrescine transport system permease protein PotH [Marinibacterium anthonyi]
MTVAGDSRSDRSSGGRGAFAFLADRGLRLVLPAAIFLVLAFALPILGIVGRSLFDPDLTLKNYAEVLRAPSTVKVFLNTFRIALEVTVVTAVLGYLLAYGMARARGRWAAVMLGAVMLPLWTSDLVRTFSWTIILGRRGPLNTLLMDIGLIDRPLSLLFNETAVVIGTTHILMPMMVLPLYAAMRAVDRRLVLAALSLGASPFAAFRDVFVPLTLPGFIAGALLTYVLAVGMYVTPAALGSPETTMIAQVIETQGRRQLDWGTATALSTLLLLAVAVSLAVAQRVGRVSRTMMGQS